MQHPFALQSANNVTFRVELVEGPPRSTMYVTALYFTMTCMTSVGFGNVAPETDSEKVFTICMMIIGGESLMFNEFHSNLGVISVLTILILFLDLSSLTLRDNLWSCDNNHPANDLCNCPISRDVEQCPRVYEAS